MKRPEMIKTTERIFKVQLWDKVPFLCNLEHINTEDVGQINKIWHYWNYNFRVLSKKDLRDMIRTNQTGR